MSKTRASSSTQPSAVCWECGRKYGCGVRDGAYSAHKGKCGVCHQEKLVTDPRDFGYLNRDWKKHVKATPTEHVSILGLVDVESLSYSPGIKALMDGRLKDKA